MKKEELKIDIGMSTGMIPAIKIKNEMWVKASDVHSILSDGERQFGEFIIWAMARNWEINLEHIDVFMITTATKDYGLNSDVVICEYDKDIYKSFKGAQKKMEALEK